MPLDGIRVIAWDFDGVLNCNIQNGALVWSQNFERDLDLPVQSFAKFLFQGRFQRAMIGAGDLKQDVSDWLMLHETPHTADDILSLLVRQGCSARYANAELSRTNGWSQSDQYHRHE